MGKVYDILPIKEVIFLSVLNDRIKEQRLKRGLTLLQVADFLGVKEATAQRYESGEIKNIKHETIVQLAELFHTTPAYLMGWEDDNADVFSIPNIEPPPKTYKVPRVGTIACGTPITAIQNIDTYDDVPDYIHCDFTLLCKGDSMIDARINDGDVVYIKQQSDVDSGEIAAVLIDNEATLKRVYKKTNRIILRAANIKYDDLEYEDEQLNEIRILGRVVGFTSVNVR